MTPREAMERAVPIFARYPDVPFAELRELMRHDGISLEDIESIVEFMPLAFGRSFLGDGVTFASDYVRTDLQGRERFRKRLSEERWFMEATMYAPIVMMKMGQDAFASVATRSSEVRAINEALDAGANLEDLVASPPVLIWRGPEELPEESGTPSKPWWKFW